VAYQISDMTTLFRLREAIEAAGLNQSELARRSGVGLRTVARLCRNETAQVSLATLDKLARVLGVEPGELIARQKKRR
jgi:transcriptional regulator with XRE-family HTH domain